MAHVDRATLIDYRAHRLPEAEELRVQRHLEACVECRDLAVEVSALFDPPEDGEEELTSAEKAAGWTRVHATLEEQGWFAARRPAVAQKEVRRWGAAKVALLAAACVVLAMAGFPYLSMLGAQEQILIPVGAFKGPRDESATVRLPALLKLRLTPTEIAPSYRVDLRDEKDREARTFRRLRPDLQGLLSVRLHRWSLAPGPYRLVVRPEGPGIGDPSGEYQIRILSR